MKILIVDDDIVYRRILQVTLVGWGYEVTVARDGDEALQILSAPDPPQLAILDWIMPGKDGPQVCEEVRRWNREAYTYLVLLTAKGEKDDLIEGLRAGADDYLIKPFNPHELRARLFAGRRILELQNQLLAAQEALRYQATRDGLTGAWNRRAMYEALDREVSRAKRETRPLSVILCDLDFFKKINDTQGHAAGDAVLCEAVRRLEGSLRPYDMVGRYGGEEFLVLLPGCVREDALRLAERLRQRLAEVPVVFQDRSIHVTMSQGGAFLEYDAEDTPATLLQRADEALYQAKANGRNRVEFRELGLLVSA